MSRLNRVISHVLLFAIVLVQAMVLQHRMAHGDGVLLQDARVIERHHAAHLEDVSFHGHDDGDKLVCSVVDHLAADLFLFTYIVLSASLAPSAEHQDFHGRFDLSLRPHYRDGARAPPSFFSVTRTPIFV